MSKKRKKKTKELTPAYIQDMLGLGNGKKKLSYDSVRDDVLSLDLVSRIESSFLEIARSLEALKGVESDMGLAKASIALKTHVDKMHVLNKLLDRVVPPLRATDSLIENEEIENIEIIVDGKKSNSFFIDLDNLEYDDAS